MMIHPALDYLVHFHVVFASCLDAWVIAGRDPVSHRPSVPARLVVLSIEVAVHSVLAQLLYSGWFVEVHAPLEQLRHGAELMYYGGDIAERLLAIALVTTRHPVRKPCIQRAVNAAQSNSGAARLEHFPVCVEEFFSRLFPQRLREFGRLVASAQINRFSEGFRELNAGRAAVEMIFDDLAGVGRQFQIQIVG